MTKRVIVNADDLGISKGTNRAILKAFKEGILTSASLMANMPGSEDAVQSVIRNNPGLGIGIHLSLTLGRSVLERSQIPLLADESGYFKNSFLALYTLVHKDDDALLQIRAELEAQFVKIRAERIEIDHVNSQHHVHMIPPIFDVVADLTVKFGCKHVRISDESLLPKSVRVLPGYYGTSLLNGSFAKKVILSRFAKSNQRTLGNIRPADYFFGILHTSHMNKRNLKYILSSAKPGVTEIVTHPGFYSCAEPDERRSRLLERFLRSDNRRVEFQALVDDSVRASIQANNIALIRFRDIGTSNRSASS